MIESINEVKLVKDSMCCVKLVAYNANGLRHSHGGDEISLHLLTDPRNLALAGCDIATAIDSPSVLDNEYVLYSCLSYTC